MRLAADAVSAVAGLPIFPASVVGSMPRSAFVRRLPELTSAFLDKIGGFASEEELLTEVRGELEKQLKFHQQRRVRQQITALLTVAAKWELPKDLLRRQAGREYERMVLELQSSGFTDAMIRQYMNELQQNALASTAKALKEHFILERIAEDQKIEAEPDDFDREVELIAEQSDESPRRVRARLEKRGLMDTLRNQIVERKVIELRFGLKGEQPRTLEEVGRAFGVTRERIRQIENNTLKKLEGLPEAQGLRDCV